MNSETVHAVLAATMALSSSSAPTKLTPEEKEKPSTTAKLAIDTESAKIADEYISIVRSRISTPLP